MTELTAPNPFHEIRNHLDAEGRLRTWPAKRARQLVALRYLAGKFEPGVDYTERQVNELLNRHHTFGDPATLRRELFDARLLGREGNCSRYWVPPTE